MRYFETKFLEEADQFISGLDRKTVKKIFYNIDLAEQTNDPKLLRNFKMTFGSFEQSLQDFKSDFLHFGTRPKTKRLWSLQPTVS
jgi:hypothetical protein